VIGAGPRRAGSAASTAGRRGSASTSRTACACTPKVARAARRTGPADLRLGPPIALRPARQRRVRCSRAGDGARTWSASALSTEARGTSAFRAASVKWQGARPSPSTATLRWALAETRPDSASPINLHASWMCSTAAAEVVVQPSTSERNPTGKQRGSKWSLRPMADLGCGKRATFGDSREWLPVACKAHRRPGDVDVSHVRRTKYQEVY
jgi:hypothetical protein